MGAREELTITINGKEYVSKEAQKAGKGVEDLEGKAKKFGETTKKLKVGLLSAVAAIVAIQHAASKLTKAFGTQEDAELKLQAALKATKGQLGLTKTELGTFATELSRMTGVADESIIAAEGVMTTFTKIGSQVFPQAMKAAADMSAMFGQDLQQSVVQLGTALNDPITGVGRLRRIGVSFTQDQQDMIRALTETGDLLGAQNIILQELNNEFGGVAEQMGGGWTQSVQRLKNAFGDLTELGGKAISEFFRPAVDWLTRMAESAYDARVNAAAIAKYWQEGAQTQDDVELAYQATIDKIGELNAKLKELQEARDAGERTRGTTGGRMRERQNEIDAIQREIVSLEQWVSALKEVADAKGAVTAAEIEAENLRQRVYETIGVIMDEQLTSEDRERQAIQQKIDLLAEYRNSLESGTEEYKKIQGILNDLVTKREQIGKSVNEEVQKLTLIEKLMQRATEDAEEKKEALFAIKDIDAQIADAMLASDNEWLTRLMTVREELEKIAGIKSDAAGNTAGGGTESTSATEAVDMFGVITSGLEGFSAEIANAVTQYGAMGLVIVAVQESLAGFLAAAGPLIENVIQPISLYLRELGAMLGELIAPALQTLAPIIQTVMSAFSVIQKALLLKLAPVFQIVAQVFEMLTPVIQGVGVVIEKLGVGFLWIYNNVIRHVGNGIMTVFNLVYDAVVAVANGFISVYNALVGKKKEKALLAYRGLNQGWAPAISADTLASMGQTAAAASYESDYEGAYGGAHGGGTSVQHAYYYLTLNFNSAVIGAGGLEEVGGFCVDAIQEYVGTGGRVTFLEATA